MSQRVEGAQAMPLKVGLCSPHVFVSPLPQITATVKAKLPGTDEALEQTSCAGRT